MNRPGHSRAGTSLWRARGNDTSFRHRVAPSGEGPGERLVPSTQVTDHRFMTTDQVATTPVEHRSGEESGPVVRLTGGVLMPQLGFGVSESRDADGAVSAALELGYRSIDTAAVYGNEDGVGAALASSGLQREDYFVTTKVWDLDLGRDHVLRAAHDSLDRLGLDHVDLYLVHWPSQHLDPCTRTWGAMQELQADGRTRAIGVSNFRPTHLRRMIDFEGIDPAVHQIELHPHHQQHAIRDLHSEHGIATEAWGPLGRGAVLTDPVLHAVAARHQRTVAQIVLRWHLEQGHIVIPKSDDPARMAENRAVCDFALSPADRQAIAALDAGDAGRIGPVSDEPLT
jgi:2,5-diketo-D-gluconate reductase A